MRSNKHLSVFTFFFRFLRMVEDIVRGVTYRSSFGYFRVYTAAFCAVFLLITNQTAAQVWPRIYNLSSYTYFNDMVEAYDGGYILGGSNLPGLNLKDSWVLKTDINGNTLWTKNLSATYYISLTGLDKLPDGGLVLTGSNNKFGFGSMYFMKLNACGEKQWCNLVVDTVGYGYSMRVKYVDNGITALVRYYGGNPYRAWLFRMDLEGNMIWQKVVNSSNQSLAGAEASELYITANHDYLIVGDIGDFYPGPASTPRPMLIRTDSAGNDLWTLAWGHTCGLKGMFAWQSVENSSGSFYTPALHMAWDTVSSGHLPCFLKTSANGQEMYYRHLIPVQYSGEATSLVLPYPDTLLILTTWYNNYDSIPKLSVIKCDSLGGHLQNQIIWVNKYVGRKCGSLITSDGKYLCAATLGSDYPSPAYTYLFKLNMDLQFDTGNFAPRTYDSLCPHAITTSTTNLDGCGVIADIREPLDNPLTTGLQIFPNPATSKLSIILPKYLKRESGNGDLTVTTFFHQWSVASLQAFDTRGRMILCREIPREQTQFTLDVTAWAHGMYYFRLIHRDQAVATQKVLLK
jgi:hypothetical protein